MKVQAIEAQNITLSVGADTGKFIGKQRAGQVAAKKVAAAEIPQQSLASRREVVDEALQIVNRTMENYNTELRFSLDDKSKEMVVKVIDTRDNSVVRQIPAEHVLKMVAHIKEMLGTVIDKFI